MAIIGHRNYQFCMPQYAKRPSFVCNPTLPGIPVFYPITYQFSFLFCSHHLPIFKSKADFVEIKATKLAMVLRLPQMPGIWAQFAQSFGSVEISTVLNVGIKFIVDNEQS